METPGETYLDYVGLPREHPRWSEVANQISDALLEAAESEMERACRDDPSLSAMLDERYTPWLADTVAGSEVAVGMLVAVPDAHSLWLGPSRPGHEWTPVRSVLREDDGHDRRVELDGRTIRVFDRSSVDVLLPVPFDLAPLVAEHRARTGGRAA